MTVVLDWSDQATPCIGDAYGPDAVAERQAELEAVFSKLLDGLLPWFAKGYELDGDLSHAVRWHYQDCQGGRRRTGADVRLRFVFVQP